MVNAASDASGAPIDELLDCRTPASFEIYDQFSRQVPSAIGEHDPKQDGCISLTGILNGERELIGLLAAP